MQSLMNHLACFLIGAVSMALYLHYSARRRRAMAKNRDQERMANLTLKERSRARIGELIDKQIAESASDSDDESRKI